MVPVSRSLLQVAHFHRQGQRGVKVCLGQNWPWCMGHICLPLVSNIWNVHVTFTDTKVMIRYYNSWPMDLVWATIRYHLPFLHMWALKVEPSAYRSLHTDAVWAVDYTEYHFSSNWEQTKILLPPLFSPPPPPLSRPPSAVVLSCVVFIMCAFLTPLISKYKYIQTVCLHLVSKFCRETFGLDSLYINDISLGGWSSGEGHVGWVGKGGVLLYLVWEYTVNVFC